MKRLLLVFLVSLSAWSVAAWLQHNISPSENLAYYGSQLEEAIHNREYLARQLMEAGQLERWVSSPTSMETITTLPLFLFRNDTLTGFTDHRIPLKENPRIKRASEVVELADGTYLLHQSRKYFDEAAYDIIAAIPLYREYPLENKQLAAHFPMMPALPAGVTWSKSPGEVPVSSQDGNLIGYLNSKDRLLLPGKAMLLTSLLVFGLVGMLISGLGFAYRIGGFGWFFWGLLCIPCWFFGASYLMTMLFPIPPPGLLECFYVPIGKWRAGSFLILAVSLYGCWWYLYPQPVKVPAFFSLPGKFFHTTIHYALAGIPLLWISGQARYGLLYSNEAFDFANIFNLPHAGYVIVGALLLSTVPLSFFSQSIVLALRQNEIGERQRLFASLISLLPLGICAPLLDLALLPTLLTGLIYIALLDLFADYRRPSLTWFIIWLVFFSGLCAVLFFKYQIDRDIRQMTERAQALCQDSLPSYPEEMAQPPVEFQPVLSASPELVSSAMINPATTATQFDYAIFEEGWRLDQQGSPDLSWQSSISPPAPGQLKQRLTSNRIDLLYQHPEGKMVLIGKQLGGYATPLALFSFLFVLLLLLVMLLAAAQHYLGNHPALYWAGFGHPSLRYRIQLSFIALIIGAFVLIAMVTVSSFKRSAIQQYGDRLSDKLNTLVADLQFKLREDPATEEADLAEELSRIHRTDLAIYDQKGFLLGASPDLLFRHGLLPLRMAPAAQRALSSGKQSLRLYSEQTGQYRYRIVYLPIPGGERYTQRYLGVPFPTREGTLDPNLYAFIGTLINVYVFLLLAASALTIVVANSITKPLDRIGGKLQSLQLGYNEPLEWHSDDEIGQFIQAYNEMIIKLEGATTELRRSEREGAWREMAKQVAHEIKNPLTPMKLSLQHLQRAHRSNPERADVLIDRVGRTLIEQIDGLARIAEAFSSFAKMPQAHNAPFLLNELLESVYQLFRNKASGKADFNLELPIHPLWVYADRAQLLRVLNNLITNGIQAIPSGRRPYLSLHLYRYEDDAVVRVEDNGTGIPDSMQDRVFYPNFTTKSSGMGLGLAMCKNIVEQAGGRIYFETEIDKGTTFFVELPLETKKNPPVLEEPEE